MNYKESILNILKPEDTEEGSKNKPFESSRCTYLLHPFSDSAVSEHYPMKKWSSEGIRFPVSIFIYYNF